MSQSIQEKRKQQVENHAVELYGETDTNVYDECNSNVVSAELSMNRIS